MFKKGKKLSPKTITHQYSGVKVGNKVTIQGSYDINVWYSYDNDTKTEVLKETNTYQETITVQGDQSIIDNEEIIVRSLSGPSCIKAEIVDDSIHCTIEKVLGIELVGDTKVRISVDDDIQETWEEIHDSDETIDEQIEQNVQEDYLTDDVITKDSN